MCSGDPCCASFSVLVDCILSSCVSPSSCFNAPQVVILLVVWCVSLFHRPVVYWFVGGCSTVPPGFVGINLHLTYPFGCGFKFRAVWPASSHLAVFREALFSLYIASV